VGSLGEDEEAGTTSVYCERERGEVLVLRNSSRCSSKVYLELVADILVGKGSHRLAVVLVVIEWSVSGVSNLVGLLVLQPVVLYISPILVFPVFLYAALGPFRSQYCPSNAFETLFRPHFVRLCHAFDHLIRVFHVYDQVSNRNIVERLEHLDVHIQEWYQRERILVFCQIDPEICLQANMSFAILL
jgi:hypothetical protein